MACPAMTSAILSLTKNLRLENSVKWWSPHITIPVMENRTTTASPERESRKKSDVIDGMA